MNVNTALAKARAQFPQLRLGQLLANVLDSPTELYYLTDDVLSVRLQDYMEAHEVRTHYKESHR